MLKENEIVLIYQEGKEKKVIKDAIQ